MFYALLKRIFSARGTYVLILFLFLSLFMVTAYRASDVLFSTGQERMLAATYDGYVGDTASDPNTVTTATASGVVDTTSDPTINTTIDPLTGAATGEDGSTDGTMTAAGLPADGSSVGETDTAIVAPEKEPASTTTRTDAATDAYYTDAAGNTIHVDTSSNPTEDSGIRTEETSIQDVQDSGAEPTDSTAGEQTEPGSEEASVQDEPSPTGVLTPRVEENTPKEDVVQEQEEPLWFSGEDETAANDTISRTDETVRDESSTTSTAQLWSLRRENSTGAETVPSSANDATTTRTFHDIAVSRTRNDLQPLYTENDENIKEVIDLFSDEVLKETYLFEKRDDPNLRGDSDGDGISDYDEVALYRTDPFKSATREGELSDGEKILRGIDPASDQPIVFEDPRRSPEPAVEEYSVDSLQVTKREHDETTGKDVVRSLAFTGKALPLSFVTLYIFSTPVVVTVKTDSEGRWEYELDTELSDGEHEIYVATTDNSGKIVAKSGPVPFVKTAEAAELGAAEVATAQEQTSSLRSDLFLIILGISIVGVLIMILIVGLDMRRIRLREERIGNNAEESNTTI